MSSHLAAKTVYCAVSCQTKWSSAAAWSSTHWGHLIFERKVPYPISTVNLRGANKSNTELGQASPACPSGDSPPRTPRAAHLSANTLGFSLCPGLFYLYPVCLAQGKSPAYSPSLNNLRRRHCRCAPKPPKLPGNITSRCPQQPAKLAPLPPPFSSPIYLIALTWRATPESLW